MTVVMKAPWMAVWRVVPRACIEVGSMVVAMAAKSAAAWADEMEQKTVVWKVEMMV